MCSTGFPNDKLGWQNDMARLTFGMLDNIDQGFCSMVSQAMNGLPDRG
jgi:hypothetical protein